MRLPFLHPAAMACMTLSSSAFFSFSPPPPFSSRLPLSAPSPYSRIELRPGQMDTLRRAFGNEISLIRQKAGAAGPLRLDSVHTLSSQRFADTLASAPLSVMGSDFLPHRECAVPMTEIILTSKDLFPAPPTVSQLLGVVRRLASPYSAPLLRHKALFLSYPGEFSSGIGISVRAEGHSGQGTHYRTIVVFQFEHANFQK